MDLLKFAFNQIVEELVSDLKYRINSDNHNNNKNSIIVIKLIMNNLDLHK